MQYHASGKRRYVLRCTMPQILYAWEPIQLSHPGVGIGSSEAEIEGLSEHLLQEEVEDWVLEPAARLNLIIRLSLPPIFRVYCHARITNEYNRARVQRGNRFCFQKYSSMEHERRKVIGTHENPNKW